MGFTKAQLARMKRTRTVRNLTSGFGDAGNILISAPLSGQRILVLKVEPLINQTQSGIVFIARANSAATATVRKELFLNASVPNNVWGNDDPDEPVEIIRQGDTLRARGDISGLYDVTVTYIPA